MKVVSVVGSRPQFVKLAPVSRALSDSGHEHVVIHTGPAYLRDIYHDLFERYGLRDVDQHLGIEPSSASGETAQVMVALEPVLARLAPDWVLGYGDTDTTLATILTAARCRLRSAHVEAGLRSYNRAMNQEHNRVAADHTADLLLAPTPGAVERLRGEGLADRTRLVGDVMVDVLTRAVASPPGEALPQRPDAPYVVATLQRTANTADPQRLDAILDALADLPLPVLLVVSPRLFRQAQAHRLTLEGGSLRRVPPLTYLQMVHTLAGASGVVTDSAGVQKEAYVLGVPCTTLRAETEWPETLEGGWNVLQPDPGLLAEVAVREAPSTPRGTPFGDGHAAQAIVTALEGASPAGQP